MEVMIQIPTTLKKHFKVFLKNEGYKPKKDYNLKSVGDFVEFRFFVDDELKLRRVVHDKFSINYMFNMDHEQDLMVKMVNKMQELAEIELDMMELNESLSAKDTLFKP